MFAFNSSYIGSRLGICWEVLAEKHKDFRDPHVRDPYPLIAEKAGLEKGKNVSWILRSVAVGNSMLFPFYKSSDDNNLKTIIMCMLWQYNSILLFKIDILIIHLSF